MMSMAALLSNLIGGPEEFAGLLSLLPDGFFRLSREAQERIWQQLTALALAGERDLDQLAAAGAVEVARG